MKRELYEKMREKEQEFIEKVCVKVKGKDEDCYIVRGKSAEMDGIMKKFYSEDLF